MAKQIVSMENRVAQANFLFLVVNLLAECGKSHSRPLRGARCLLKQKFGFADHYQGPASTVAKKEIEL